MKVFGRCSTNCRMIWSWWLDRYCMCAYCVFVCMYACICVCACWHIYIFDCRILWMFKACQVNLWRSQRKWVRLMIFTVCDPIWDNYAQWYFCGKPQLKTIGKICNNFTHKLLTLVVSEWTLQSTNPGNRVCFSIRSWKSLFGFHTHLRITAIVWCCDDEGTYRRSLLSDNASFIKHRSIHGRLTIH